jgi:hypothetical protein
MRLIRRPPPFNPTSNFTPEVQELVAETYGRSRAVLEYGSGGSTLLAASLGCEVTSVESDAAWAERMNERLREEHPGAKARVIHVDIGRTGMWGKPLKPEGMANYYRYPLAVWDEPGFSHPDAILIDGRFRVACFCTALMRIERPVRVLFDDYVKRPDYHQVERLAQPAMVGPRMAVFDLEPGPIPKGEWTWVVAAFFKTTYTKK